MMLKCLLQECPQCYLQHAESQLQHEKTGHRNQTASCCRYSDRTQHLVAGDWLRTYSLHPLLCLVPVGINVGKRKCRSVCCIHSFSWSCSVCVQGCEDRKRFNFGRFTSPTCHRWFTSRVASPFCRCCSVVRNKYLCILINRSVYVRISIGSQQSRALCVADQD